MHRYVDLNVWQRSIGLCVDVYEVTKLLPRDEEFGLSSQMRRAVVSISANIAEGCAFDSSKQLRRFLRTALGSAQELDTHLIVSERTNLLTQQSVVPVREELKEIRAMIIGLHRSL